MELFATQVCDRSICDSLPGRAEIYNSVSGWALSPVIVVPEQRPREAFLVL